jgi:hypothetical protein
MADVHGAEAPRKLLNDGWNYHDSESERLARELEAAAEAGIEFNVVAPFLHLSTHAIGEHLGDWARALRLGKRVLDGQTPTLETAKAWGRLYVAAVLAGDLIEAANSELSYLKAAGDDFGAALLDMRFMLAGALVASSRACDGARLYRGALDLVGQIRQTAPLDRTIAVASNNLGWELYEMSSRSADEDALMQLCADTSLKFWLKCGDWINEERALYLKALVSMSPAVLNLAWPMRTRLSPSSIRRGNARSMLRFLTLCEHRASPRWGTRTDDYGQLATLMPPQQA